MGGQQSTPISATKEYRPSPDDEQEELQQKYEKNIKASWFYILYDALDPAPEPPIPSGAYEENATDYQANAWVAKEYMEQKKKNNMSEDNKLKTVNE